MLAGKDATVYEDFCGSHKGDDAHEQRQEQTWNAARDELPQAVDIQKRERNQTSGDEPSRREVGEVA
jgi:hypothetical protein